MAKQGSLLVVDDDEDILIAAKLLLKRHFSQVYTCPRPEQIPKLMARESIDVILLDMNFGPGESNGQQGCAWLEKILSIDPQAVVVMITAHGDLDTAVNAMKIGATDFIAKPWQNEKVIATLSSALRLRATRQEAVALRSTNKALAQATSFQAEQPILGESEPMQQVMSMVSRAAPTDASVLILGENGTGKELVAREVHNRSHRAENVFMSVDLGALSETLFESELFGHKRGAFTGAKDDRVGRLVAANGGTLFLDEIGNIPLHLQAKLLTVLEQRSVTPLGANQAQDLDIRVVAATNMEVKRLQDDKCFRQDLLFRLNTVELHLPPLRERAEDIISIANYYLTLYCRKYNSQEKTLSHEAIGAMRAHHWPGNVRALRHAIERAVILAQHEVLLPEDFLLGDSASVADTSLVSPQQNTKPLLSEGTDLNLAVLEKQAVMHALQQYSYNISHAAKALGLTRAALYRRMEKYGI